MRKRTFLFVLTLLSVSLAALAQPKKVVTDKVTAIVGDRIILLSDIKNSLADIARQGGTVPENGECILTEQAIISKVMK
jgi:peptidyl-prolyl cis-trans isomerase SurA